MEDEELQRLKEEMKRQSKSLKRNRDEGDALNEDLVEREQKRKKCEQELKQNKKEIEETEAKIAEVKKKLDEQLTKRKEAFRKKIEEIKEQNKKILQVIFSTLLFIRLCWNNFVFKTFNFSGFCLQENEEKKKRLQSIEKNLETMETTNSKLEKEKQTATNTLTTIEENLNKTLQVQIYSQ